jgi:hypothetical protein
MEITVHNSDTSTRRGAQGAAIVEFPTITPEDTPDEHARRLRVEVDRLASLPVTEWLYYLERGEIAEKHGVTSAALKEMIEATIKANEKKKREDKAEDRQRVEKEQSTARREQERKRREEERKQERAAREEERERKERVKAFAAIAKLPRPTHEARLSELAKRLGEDLDFLRDEFVAYIGPEETADKLEPWYEPVETAALLTELMAQLRRYVVLNDDAAVAITLWVMFAWVHEIAVPSPILVITSAEPDAGKTTTLGVIGRSTPRPYHAVEMTGANVHHIVDQRQPTLIVDEADQVFNRKPDLMHVVNAGWATGTKIPRMIRGEIREFDPFCPKVIGMKGLELPGTTASRAIVVKLWPKLPSEQIADFRHVDDDDFVALRRKLLRWAADNAAALRDANPVMPPGFGNRLAANWRLQLAIADLAGGAWLKRARAAAVKLSHKRHRPSEGVKLLAALRPMFATRQEITSAEMVAQLVADPDGEWVEFRNRSPITQRQVAALLAEYEIFPNVLHPTKRAGLSRRGYRRPQFDDAFARFLPRDPNIRTRQRTKPRKTKGNK